MYFFKAGPIHWIILIAVIAGLIMGLRLLDIEGYSEHVGGYSESEGRYISSCEPNTGDVADFTDPYGHEWRGMRWIFDSEINRMCLTDCTGVQQSCKPCCEPFFDRDDYI